MINNRIFVLLCTLLFSVCFSTCTWATFKGENDDLDQWDSLAVIAETKGAHQCCAPNGISYCDISSGHYVCNDGGYSTCICQSTAPVTTYASLTLGCCLWHGGVAANHLGQVVCQDGSISEVCST